MVFKDVPKQQAWEKYLEVERPAREEFMRELEEVKHGPPIHDRKQ